jgi:hypothetical protein
VDDVLSMHVVQRQHHLVDQIRRVFFKESGFFAGYVIEKVKKVAVRHKLHHNEVILGTFKQLDNSDNVGVVKLFK